MNKKAIIWLAVIIFLIHVIGKGVENIKLNSKLLNFVKDIETKLGYKVTITSGVRSYQKQAALKKTDPRNAAAGNSDHEYGNAIDIVLSKGGKVINKNSSPLQWKASGVTQLAKKHGLNWGGNFTNYYDPVHFYL